MKRMVTEEEIIDLIQKYAPGFDPSTIEEGDILQNAILGLDEDGDIVKGNLFGKYVRIIPAPASTTLTNEEVESFKKGVFIEGNFLGFENIVFFPPILDRSENKYDGIMFGSIKVTGATSCTSICRYSINATTRIITKDIEYLGFGREKVGSTPDWQLLLYGKGIPLYPSNTTKHYAFEQNVGGSLAWVELINNIAPEFDSTTTYAENALVMYQGTLYACTNAAGHTGDWDAADFTRKYISEVI